nr:MAG TPA: hypothetical protein [Caudoviricetes sp.]
MDCSDLQKSIYLGCFEPILAKKQRYWRIGRDHQNKK